jgi:hypothetical protein
MSNQKHFADISRLEAALKLDPDNEIIRRRLMTAYFLVRANAVDRLMVWLFGRNRYVPRAKHQMYLHVRWVIENKPRSALSSMLCSYLIGVENPKGYQACKTLWLELVKQNPVDVGVLQNAAIFFSIDDSDCAETLLLRVLNIDPANVTCIEELEFMRELRRKHEKRSL